MTALPPELLGALPLFATLDPERQQALVRQCIAENREAVKALLAKATSPGSTPTWETLIEPLTESSEALSRAWGPVSHLYGVWATPEWRAAHNALLPEITAYGVELAQSEELYTAYRQIAEGSGFAQLSPVRQKIVIDELRDFRLSGIGLPAEQKERYKELSLKLSELSSTFAEHVMDDVAAWSRPMAADQEPRLAGLTPEGLAAAHARAGAKGQDGWIFGLDFPSYDSVISHATDRALREEFYTAYATRASDQGGHPATFDNTATMQQILRLRQEMATLLGFGSYAELSLATKMADSPAAVEKFLLDLGHRARLTATAEKGRLERLAADDGITDFAPWDVSIYSERQRTASLGLSDELLRPYFAYPRVLEGLFGVIHRWFGVDVTLVEGIETWHPDVSVYALAKADEPGAEPFGLFYLDPYARPETKRGGAWMDSHQGRRKLASGRVQEPVAYMVCNFTPPLPGSDKPSLLTHNEVKTLFHEFGHGLHHLLTRVDEGAAAGIRGVEWDAVELPSQFMENWCYDATTLHTFARHFETGEPMPDAMIEALKADRRFQTGLMTLRQIEFSLFDLRLHGPHEAGETPDVLGLLWQTRNEVAVIQPPTWNRMPWSFTHIFSGGYAAGYYSYKWAEVLSSDAFAAFEETGFSPETGRAFLEGVLSQGSSRPAMELYRSFRGRAPTVDALLRHSGLADEAGMGANDARTRVA